MSTKFHIPETVEGVAKLLTAHTWERAAIVWAYVHSSEDQTNVKHVNNDKLYTPEGFAALKIAGLRSHVTVQKYWAAWQKAIDNGDAKPASPGDDITIPNSKWIKNTAWTGTDDDPRAGTASRHVSEQQIANAIKAKPSIVADAIKADPEVADAAWNAIEEKGIERANDAQLAAIQRGGCATPMPPKPSKLNTAWEDAMKMASRGEALQALEEFVDAIEAGAKRVADNGIPQDNEGEQIRMLADRIADVAAGLYSLNMVEVA